MTTYLHFTESEVNNLTESEVNKTIIRKKRHSSQASQDDYISTNGRGLPKRLHEDLCVSEMWMQIWVCVFMRNSVKDPSLNLFGKKG